MKKIKVSGFLLFLSGVGAFAQVSKTMLRLPDTGQTQQFTATVGEDADYLINAPSFIVHNNGAVTDSITGLMWQQVDGGEMTYEQALTYAEDLSLGGYSDWRLPTAQEAFSILNHSKPNPALDGTVFPGSGAGYWWTSEKQTGSSTKVWVTNAGGGIGNHAKSETISAGGTKKFHVRAVRDASLPPLVPVQFLATDSVVADQLTGLEWQRFVLSDTMNWEAALNFAETLVIEGKADWRLPNIKELQSINDETISQPSVSGIYFKGIGIGKYWSSTSLPNQPDKAWYLDTRFGITTYDAKTVNNHLLCVRGQSGSTVKTTDAYESKAEVHVFPNPFKDRIRLVNASESGDYALINAYGQVVYMGTNIEAADLSGISAGVYLLKYFGKTPFSVKLIKA